MEVSLSFFDSSDAETLNESNEMIALVAQKTAHSLGSVVVVNAQMRSFAELDNGLGLLADGTNSSLSSEHCIVFRKRDTKGVAEMPVLLGLADAFFAMTVKVIQSRPVFRERGDLFNRLTSGTTFSPRWDQLRRRLPDYLRTYLAVFISTIFAIVVKTVALTTTIVKACQRFTRFATGTALERFANSWHLTPPIGVVRRSEAISCIGQETLAVPAGTPRITDYSTPFALAA